MKYMTFNNSCFFAAISNLLEEIEIDVSDEDIIKESLIPYLFEYDQETYQFSSGYQIQNLGVINDYLKKYIVKLNEKSFKEGELIERKSALIKDLTITDCHKIVSLKMSDSDLMWHATIFIGMDNEKFKFNNMRKSDEEITDIVLTYDELIDRLADKVQYAWIEKISSFDVLDKKHLLDNSFKNLSILEKEIVQFSTSTQSYKNRIELRELLFRPLLLNYVDIARIMKLEDLFSDLLTLQSQYMDSFKIKEEIKLTDYIDLYLLKKTINTIMNMIQSKKKTEYYHGSKTTGIKKLYPNMSIHGEKYVYLTTKREVALIYTINAIESFYEMNSLEKPEQFHPWYSYGFNKGKLQIDEYYENAFEETYKGKSGYLYVCKEPDKNITNQTNIFCAVTTKESVEIIEEVYIDDIYHELIRLESARIILIRRFTDMTEKQIDHLNNSIKGSIKHFDLHNKPDNNYTIFLRSKFPDLFN